MRSIKRVLAFLIALAMTIACVLIPDVSVRAEGDKTLIIKDKTRTYEAYQIFSGTLDENVLSNIEWGTGVNSSALLTALKGATFSIANLFPSTCNSAADVAKILGDNKSSLTEADMALFAKLVADNKTTVKSGTGAPDGDNFKISGLDDGYYLVIDVSTLAEKDDAYSRYLVDIPQTTVINDKREVPELDKSIIEGSDLVKENVAGVGEKVEYQLDSKVPDMTGYKKYYYIVEDTMSAGLTFNDDVTVKIGSKTLVSPDDFVVTKDGQSFKLVIKDFIQYTAEDTITIKYSATVNENAVVGTAAGNTNTVHLKYSNDPKADYNGEDEPGPGEPTGVTPDKKVVTYTTKIILNKTDEEDNALAGAEFEISGTSHQTVMINEQVFEVSASGTYRRLKNGTYTTDLTLDADKYADANKYELVEHVVADTRTKEVAKKAFVGDGTNSTVKGQLVFNDLGAGTYTISETTVPAGYNKIEDIEILIEESWNADKTKVTYTTKRDGVVITETTEGSGIYELTVQNKKGIVLPSTGGIGTTIFYIAGGIMVLAAVVLLITKKRMEKE